MIKLEYDVNTSGMRVSFVLKDGPKSFDAGGFCKQGTSNPDGTRTMHQNKENLQVLRRMIEFIEDQLS